MNTELSENDLRSPEQVRFDAIVDQVVELTFAVRSLIEKVPQGSTAYVTHTTQGMGIVGVVCATICSMCVLFLILGAILIVPDIHDLRAWNDINRKDIARLQAQQQQAEKK